MGGAAAGAGAGAGSDQPGGGNWWKGGTSRIMGLLPASLFIDGFWSALRSGVGSEAAWGRVDAEPRLERDRVGERESSLSRRLMSLSLRGCSHRGSLSRRPWIFLFADSFLQARRSKGQSASKTRAIMDGAYPGAASGDLAWTTSMIFWRGSVV